MLQYYKIKKRKIKYFQHKRLKFWKYWSNYKENWKVGITLIRVSSYWILIMENLRKEMIEKIIIMCLEQNVNTTEDFVSFLVCIFYKKF